MQNILAICTFYIDSLLYFIMHSSVLYYSLYCFSCQLTLDTEINVLAITVIYSKDMY